MNINGGAIALTGAVLMGGFLTTYLWKSVMKDQVQFVNGANYHPYTRKNGELTSSIDQFKWNFIRFIWWIFTQFHSDQLDDDNPMNKIIDKVERIFQKYDIDVTTCVQKVVCTTIKNAVENVAKGSGSSTDKIFDGLSRYVINYSKVCWFDILITIIWCIIIKIIHHCKCRTRLRTHSFKTADHSCQQTVFFSIQFNSTSTTKPEDKIFTRFAYIFFLLQHMAVTSINGRHSNKWCDIGGSTFSWLWKEIWWMQIGIEEAWANVWSSTTKY